MPPMPLPAGLWPSCDGGVTKPPRLPPLVKKTGRGTRYFKCRIHPRNVRSLEAISGFGSMEARNTELQVGTGSHGPVARENPGDPSGHFYSFEAIWRALPTTHFYRSIRIAIKLRAISRLRLGCVLDVESARIGRVWHTQLFETVDLLELRSELLISGS
jgi:hypothetical protein